MDNYQKDDNLEESESTSFFKRKIKLVLLLVIVVLFIVIGTIATKGDNKKGNNDNGGTISANIAFDNNAESIMLGSSKIITASITNNPIYEVRYRSSDEKVIKVDKYGLVEGVGLGSANLVAYYFDANGKEYRVERKITVFEGNNKVSITDVSFPDGDVIIELHGEYDLGNKLIVSPSSGYIYSKVFKSSNEEIVSVDANGKITAISEGEAIINVKVNGKFDSNIKVFVSRKQVDAEIVKLPETIVFNNSLTKLKVGESKKIDFSLKPEKAVDTYLTWVSSDTTVATVDNGVVTAIATGNCDITVMSINGKSAKMFVEVTEPIDVERIVFSENSIVLKENGVYTLTPTVKPNSALDKKLTFVSNDEKIAKIDYSNDYSATIKAVSEGSTTIRVRSSNGITASIKVSVTSKNANDVSDNSGGVAVRINDTIVPSKVYNDDIKYTNPANITIEKIGSVETIKYCYAPYSSNICTPNLVYSNSFTIPSGNVYRLRIQKYDDSGKEIVGSNNDNYRNGALEYYINTKSDDYYQDIGYSLKGDYYETVAMANQHSSNTNVKVEITFVNTVTDKLKICYTTESSCNPDTNPNVILSRNAPDKFIELTGNGLWKIYISEYSNNNKVGTTKKYYVKIEKSDKGYVMAGNYYDNALDASNNSVTSNQRITFDIVDDNISKLNICLTKNGSCNPDSYPDKVITKKTVSNYIDLTSNGLWRIYVAEYNDDKFVVEKIYYLYIK